MRIRPPARRDPVSASGSIATRWDSLPDVTATPEADAADAREARGVATAADTAAAARAWGRLPEISVAVAAGLVVVAIATRLARDGSGSANLVFWVGIAAMLLPVAGRLAFTAVGRTEALGLLTTLALGLYLTRVARASSGFTGFDELIHYRTASDILDSGHLYADNPALPVSPVFPGLEIATSAIAQTTGLSLVASGLVLIGLARLLLVVSLFLLLHELSRSVRIAAAATLLYAGSSTFYSFNTQYSYESLAIGLSMFVLYLTSRLTRTRRAQPAPRSLVTIAIGVALALVFTHHLTTYATAGLVVAWAVLHLVLLRRVPSDRNPLVIGLLLALAALVWSVVVASDVFSYLGGPIASAVDGIQGLIRDGGSRRPFEAASGARANQVEQLVGTLGTAVTVLAIPLGLLALRRRAPRRALTALLVLLAVLYPASLALRVADGAWEASNRASSFLYVGVSFVVAYAVWRWRPPAFVPRLPHARAVVATAILVLVPASGILLGSSANRLPRPYAVADGPRSIDPHGIAAAEWTRRELGPGNRIAADRTNTSLLNAYGRQDVVTTLDRSVTVSPLFLSTVVGAYERDLLEQGSVGYLLVDRRIEGATTPPDGHFYEDWELTLYPDAYSRTRALDPSRLRKWDSIERVGRVFDDGKIVVYDVRGVSDAP